MSGGASAPLAPLGGSPMGSSGFVEYRSIEIPTGETVISAKVGDPQESSFVIFPDSTITAESGGAGNGRY